MRDTPYLVVDADALEANLAAMAAHARALGVALRPHAKTHKSPDVALRQLAHGAVGLTVATVAEAEIFAAAGLDDLFIAYPIWAEGSRADRLRALVGSARLRVGADSVEGVRMLAAAVRDARGPDGRPLDRADGAPLAVAVEIDSGHHRSGCAPERAAEIALAARDAGLAIDGVFTFPGHAYGVGAGEDAARDEAAALRIARDALTTAGIPCPVVSGGSTPSARSADRGVLTELRPGVYALGDAQQWELGSCAAGSIALWALATVVSRREGIVVVDAGSKVLGADRPGWATGFGRAIDITDARIMALSEHHATIALPDGARLPALGERLRIAPNHVCSAVNLADALVVASAGREIGEWPVSARGANT